MGPRSVGYKYRCVEKDGETRANGPSRHVEKRRYWFVVEKCQRRVRRFVLKTTYRGICEPASWARAGMAIDGSFRAKFWKIPRKTTTGNKRHKDVKKIISIEDGIHCGSIQRKGLRGLVATSS